jgi:hypothetical protein
MDLMVRIEREDEILEFIRLINGGLMIDFYNANGKPYRFILESDEVEAFKKYLALTEIKKKNERLD